MITKRGFVLLFMAIVSYVAVLVVEVPAFLHVCAILLAVLGAGFAWTWMGWLGLEVNLSCPRQAVVGEWITLRLQFYNRMPMPRWGLKVRLVFPPAGAEGVFRWSWLPGLRPFGETVVDLPAQCRTRGRFDIGQVSVYSGDPLGLWVRERSYKFSRELEVLPAYVELRGFPFIESGAGFRDPEKTMPTPGFSNDFYALRKYMQGDSPRWIHWLSTARRQQLMTRQFQAPVQRRVVLVLDCTKSGVVSLPGAEPFELAVSAAASVVRFAAETDHEVGLLGMGRESQLVRPAAGLDNVRQMISLLARVAQDGRRGRYDYSPAITCGAQSLIIVTCSPTVAFVKGVGNLRQDGLAISVVIAGRPISKVLSEVDTRTRELAGMGIPVCQAKEMADLARSLENPAAMPASGFDRNSVSTYQRLF